MTGILFPVTLSLGFSRAWHSQARDITFRNNLSLDETCVLKLRGHHHHYPSGIFNQTQKGYLNRSRMAGVLPLSDYLRAVALGLIIVAVFLLLNVGLVRDAREGLLRDPGYLQERLKR